MIVSLLGGVLSLNQPKEGIYQCIGRNAYGTAQASTVVTLPNNSKPDGNYSAIHILMQSCLSFQKNSRKIFPRKIL